MVKDKDGRRHTHQDTAVAGTYFIDHRHYLVLNYDNLCPGLYRNQTVVAAALLVFPIFRPKYSVAPFTGLGGSRRSVSSGVSTNAGITKNQNVQTTARAL